MKNNLYSEVFSFLELKNALNYKYRGQSPKYLSGHRFPSSLIFFNSRKEYQSFLNNVTWEIRYLSQEIDENDAISCFKIRKWLKKAIDDSKEKPIVLVPLTEYIRLCKKNGDEKFLNTIFSEIVQAESSQLIVPMLDFITNYEGFFLYFEHKERMADVFYANYGDDFNDLPIEIILDKTNKIPKNNKVVIKKIQEWISLWETGAIGGINSILIQNERVINSLISIDISVPKIKKTIIVDEKSYLEYAYNIKSDNFKIEPTNEIFKFIFNAVSNNKEIRTWDGIVSFALGNIDNITDAYFEHWESSTNIDKKIQRWFWLNEAKKINFNSELLDKTILETTNPEKFLDNIYLYGLIFEKVTINSLKDRTLILKRFKSPLFYEDLNSFKQKFDLMKEKMGGNPRKIIERIAGLYDFEFDELIRNVSIIFKEQKKIPEELDLLIQGIWPEFSAYLKFSINQSGTSICPIIEDPNKFADEYIAQYIYSKVILDHPSKTLIDAQIEFFNEWKNVISYYHLRKIPQHTDTSLSSQINDTGFILLDCAGYEWVNVLKYLFEQKNWKVNEIYPVFAQIPTSTKFFPLKDPIKTFREFDDLIHERYQYPLTIIREISKLKEIVDSINNFYKTNKTPIWLVSDHGSTSFARNGKSKNYSNIEKDHGGRYGLITKKNVYADNELLYIAQNGVHECAVSLTYDNVGNISPIGEAHGGGMPEELLAMAMKLIPPEIAVESMNLESIPDRLKYSPLDKHMIVTLQGDFQFIINKIQISINSYQKFEFSVINYKMRVLTLPLDTLKIHGLKTGENEIKLIFNSTESTKFKIEFVSGSEKTDFDTAFKL